MKKTGRVLALLLALMMMVAVVAVPASATEVSNEANVTIEVIEPRRLPACGCGGVFVARTTWESTWHANGQATCIHHRYGMDKLYIRYGTKVTACSSCGEVYSTEQVSSIKRECHGFD